MIAAGELSTWSPGSRDTKQTNNAMSRAQMAALAPQFDWPLMLRTGGLDSASTVIVSQPSAVQAVGRLPQTVPFDTWKDWLAFRFISDNTMFLQKAFDDKRFQFFGRRSRACPSSGRWKRGVALVNEGLGEAVGRIYVEQHFPPESEAGMAELIADLRAAFAERLARNAWVDDATRKAREAGRLPARLHQRSSSRSAVGDWFTAEQARNARLWCDPDGRYPLPTRVVSNGEYSPPPQTDEQRRLEATLPNGGRARAAIGSGSPLLPAFEPRPRHLLRGDEHRLRLLVLGRGRRDDRP